MLDLEKGGEFTVFPESEEFESYQEYLKTTFLTCAFWYIEALACVGRLDEAVEGFETLINYCNHLQLFSEDVDQKTGSQ